MIIKQQQPYKKIVSGRMFISYGEQVCIGFNIAADGRIGYEGEDLNNSSGPN